ncbi:MAG: hypothetical protein IOC80_09230 [Rhodobacter sp.]|nr:hypothetical protein [Rhodobacter sp.]MCA3510814.1 hypothetical protein [Rhodobacter sp.]MCA3512386.1 hypothetical protein [Rhodobacter sp.]MCA3520633.1 hypothetical protein [Rhodobacter sp.]MCA3523767.1 hypothetical protein [Rhodobacter sp.]
MDRTGDDHLALLKAAQEALNEASLRITLALKATEVVILERQMRLQAAVEQGVEDSVQRLPLPAVPVSNHRREHRPGRPRIISSDPVLQAFIVARIDRMTFDQIAEDVARHFPPERRVRKSAIHSWWKGYRKSPKPIAGQHADHSG